MPRGKLNPKFTFTLFSIENKCLPKVSNTFQPVLFGAQPHPHIKLKDPGIRGQRHFHLGYIQPPAGQIYQGHHGDVAADHYQRWVEDVDGWQSWD
jgi:hypothetical protein